jgi:hypothetical protein
MWNVVRNVANKYSRVAHPLRVVVAGVGDWISDREPRRVMR